jgi:hypothetical protein
MSSEEDYYDLSPDKRTLRSLRSDVTPITAVEELVDNVLDNWRRVNTLTDDIAIDVDIDFENSTFRIEDDSGGLNEQNVKKIFALGGSTKEQIPNSIGAYGMGAKKAILRLGNKATIKSRAEDAETGFGFVIDEEWLRSDSWEVTKQEFNDIDAGSTVIRIEGLDIELQDEEASEIDDGEGSNFETPTQFLESLREDLSRTYDEFLKGEAGPEHASVSITVNGKRVKEQEPVDWAYTPFDGYHPRFYKQYEISPDDIPNRDEPITVDIKAGLMRGGEAEKAGTDVIIQNRRILTSNTGEMGGWGTHLPSFRPNLRRTRFKVKITAENNPETLPWDTQKDRIEPNSVVTDRVFNVLQRAGEDYTKLDYDNFPIAYTKPYTQNEDSVEEYNDVQKFDYSDRKHFIADHKPDSDLPETNQISELVEYHKEELEIFAPHIVAEPFVDTYRASFDPSNQADRDYSPDSGEIWIVPDEAGELPAQELHLYLETVRDAAERHQNDGATIEFGNEEPWWQDYYWRAQQESSADLDNLDATEDVERVQNSVRIKGEEQDLPEPILVDPHLLAPDLQPIFSDALVGEDQESSTQVQLEEIGEDSSTTEEEEDTSSPDSDSSNGSSSDSDSKSNFGGKKGEEADEDDEEDTKVVDFGTTTERGSVQKRLGSERPILLEVRHSTYEEICIEVGLDPNEATAREVGQAVLDENVEIQSFVDGSEDSRR